MRHRWAGISGLVLALAGVACTVIAFHVLPEPPAPPTLLGTQVDVQIGKFRLGWRSKTQPAPAALTSATWLEREQLRLVGVSLGLVALPLAVVSWIRREGRWWGLGTCIFAVAAIAWQVVVVVFAFLVLSGALFCCVPKERPARQADTPSP